MIIGVFWTCFGLLVYVYVLYPLLVGALARRFGTPVKRAQWHPTVTIIVTAYNEEKCLRAKLDNPPNLVDVIVASDGSTDSTDRIAATYDPNRVRVLRLEGRIGKTACQNAAAAAASAEILVFTDATTRLQSMALRKLVEQFADSQI